MRQPICTPEELAEAFGELVLLVRAATNSLNVAHHHGAAAIVADETNKLEVRVYGPASRPDITV